MNRMIGDAQDFRGFILAAMEKVQQGKLSVPQANAITGLATEFHKSIKLEWDMQERYANPDINIIGGKLVKQVSSDD
jgi:hypothetical protein